MSARHGTLDLVPLHDDAAQIAVEPVVLGLRDRSGVGKHGQHESAGIVLVVEMLRVAVRIRPEPEFFVKAKPPRSRFVDYGSISRMTVLSVDPHRCFMIRLPYPPLRSDGSTHRCSI